MKKTQDRFERALLLARELMEYRSQYDQFRKSLDETDLILLEFGVGEATAETEFVADYQNKRNALIYFLQKEDAPVIEIDDTPLRQFVRNLASKATKTTVEDGLSAFDEKDWQKLENVIFYDWTSPREVIRDYLVVRPLFLAPGTPRQLQALIVEARKCFAFQNYRAVISLSRTLLEFAITDVGATIGLFPWPDGTKEYFKNYPPYKNAGDVFRKHPDEFDDFMALYVEASGLIHGREERVYEKSSALRFLLESLDLTETIYNIHREQYAKMTEASAGNFQEEVR